MIDPIDRQETIKTAAAYYCDRPALVDSITELLEKMPPVDPGVDEWCPDCKEYDPQRHMCPRFNRVIRETLHEVKAAQNGVGWIPCSERLPEESGLYIVTTPFDRFTPVCSKYFNKRGGERSFWSGHPLNEVVAWMPLPEPWKGKE